VARAFNVDGKRTTLALPEGARQQIQALMLDLDLDAHEVIIRAVAELWQREIGQPERDVFAELDAIKAKLGMTDTS
jgi:hypothetical protein